MKVDFKNQKICVFGIQGSGKTVFVKNLIRAFHYPLVYAVHLEDFEKSKAMVYHVKNYSLEHLNNFCKQVKQLAIKKECDLFIIDEADMFFRTNFELPDGIMDLILNHRHYGLTLCFVSRRPQDIPTRITESTYWTVVYKLEGRNALERLRQIDEDLSKLVEQLDYRKYEYVIKEIGKPPVKHKAVTMY